MKGVFMKELEEFFMKDKMNAAFIAGYAYRQAEEIVQEKFGESGCLTNSQIRKEVLHIWNLLLNNIVTKQTSKNQRSRIRIQNKHHKRTEKQHTRFTGRSQTTKRQVI